VHLSPSRILDFTHMKQHEHLIWTPEMVKNFWDYESQYPERYFTYKRSSEIVRQIRPFMRKGDQVLDYGCGPGYLADKLMLAGFRVEGLDFSEDTIATVNRKFEGNPLFLGAYTPERLSDTKLRFNAVTVIEVIEHLYDEQLDVLLENVRSLLEPDGIAIFTTPNEEQLEEAMILCPVSNQLFNRWQHVRSWSQDSLSSYLNNSGFEVLQTFTANFSTSFHTDHSMHPLKDKWKALKRKIKDRFVSHRKRPHLVAIARLPRRP